MQFTVPAPHAIRRGVGDVLASTSPAHRVALGCHQGNEGVLVGGVFHALVNGVHEPQLPALTFQSRVVFRAAHAAGLLRWRIKDRQAHLLTDHVIAPHQLLQLFLRHVQLFACLKVDGVDDAVGVDVFPVYMGADQHLAAVKVFRQPPRGFVGLPGIDRRALRKALHHVVEHHAAVLVVEQLGVQKIVVDALRLAVDAADERLALPCGFLFLHDVEHHAAHGGAGLCAPLVVHKMYDGHTAHRPSMTARRAALTSDNSPAAFSRPMSCTLPMLARTVRRLMLLPMPLSWRSSSFCSSMTMIRLPRQQAVT